jgi:hypothetical protein
MVQFFHELMDLLGLVCGRVCCLHLT